MQFLLYCNKQYSCKARSFRKDLEGIIDTARKLFTIQRRRATISEAFRLGLPGRTASGWYSEEETVPTSPAAPSRGPAEHRVAIGKTR